MKNRTPVLIVGAGPAGLAMALWLNKKGIPFRIIDKKTEPCVTSRALAIQPRTLEFYHQLEIADEIISAGILAPELVIKYEHRIKARIQMAEVGTSVSPYSHLLFLPQDVHEKILTKKLEQQNVVIERQTELLHFTQNHYQIEATIKTPHGEEKIIASYLCGCDGADSMVRRQLGIKFCRGAHRKIFFIADVSAAGDLAEKAVQLNVSYTDFCITMPFQELNLMRLTGVVPPDNDDTADLSFTRVSDSIKKVPA